MMYFPIPGHPCLQLSLSQSKSTDATATVPLLCFFRQGKQPDSFGKHASSFFSATHTAAAVGVAPGCLEATVTPHKQPGKYLIIILHKSKLSCHLLH